MERTVGVGMYRKLYQVGTNMTRKPYIVDWLIYQNMYVESCTKYQLDHAVNHSCLAYISEYLC